MGAAEAEPRPAAALILIDRCVEADPKLLVGRRHAGHAFLPGKFVFPGGRSEAEDLEVKALNSLSPQIRHRFANPAAGAPVVAPDALALTAIREVFEETGFLVGTHGEPPTLAPQDTSWKRFAAANVIPDLSKLHYVARALTPIGFSRRFDTHFFAADAKDIAKTLDGHVHEGAELVELRWVTLSELATLDILPVTQFIAAELAKRLAAGLGHDLPVPYFFMQDDRWIRAEF